MIFNKHFALAGQHSVLSPSKYHWINYDEEKFEQYFLNSMAVKRGNEEHALAETLIRMGIMLPGNGKTLSMHVNDAIRYKMSAEQMFFYSENSFGTADAACFRRNKLRIHDLKTGSSTTSEHQLEVLAALFCLEYGYKPFDIDIELRIYQHQEARIYEGDQDLITHIMSKIVTFDKRIRAMRMEAPQ